MPQWFYKALMVLATAIWGLGTVVVKAAVGEVSPAWIVGFRFLAAGILLGVIMAPKLLHRLDGKHLMAGAVLGVLLFLIPARPIAPSSPPSMWSSSRS